MVQSDLKKWVNDGVKYLRDKEGYDRLYHRPTLLSLQDHLDKRSCQKTYDEFVADCADIEKDLNDAIGKLHTLLKYYARHQLEPFLTVEREIKAVCSLATDAKVKMQLAMVDLSIEHPPKTRALSLQKSALIFADAAVGVTAPRDVRKLAKEIMQATGLEEPDDKTISNWLKEIRQMGNS